MAPITLRQNMIHNMSESRSHFAAIRPACEAGRSGQFVRDPVQQQRVHDSTWWTPAAVSDM
ncbi:hypothetical protein A4G26_15550 [Mycobacterium kansasii]|nr:hypothetical protein A4G26_15550 [Mycobacterium kansasii]